jgi:gamma-glutamylcysteine synthetase
MKLQPQTATLAPDHKMFMMSLDGGGAEVEVAEASHLHERIRQMEEEQEELNASLMDMTSHFAKVGIRAWLHAEQTESVNYSAI